MRYNTDEQNLKAYIKHFLQSKEIDITNSSRHCYHIRFALNGELSDFKKLFTPLDIEVENSSKSCSTKSPTYLLIAKTKLNGVEAGTKLYWVNNAIQYSQTGSKLFVTKDLSPDKLQIVGNLYNISELINKVSIEVNKKYDSCISEQLINLLEASKKKNEVIRLDKVLLFEKEDLVIISKDFGEILSAIWLMSKFNFSQVFFPKNSNEKFIDFFAKKVSYCYPISVKSGGGGKVLLQNIIDAIDKRNKKKKKNNNHEPSKKIIEIVNKNNRNSQMILLHQYLNSQMINDLATLTSIEVNLISIETLKNWLNNKSTDELLNILKDWWKNYSQPRKRTLEGDDKLRFIISPLGEKIKILLNENQKFKESLNNLAHQVSLLQINIDIHKDKIIFNKSFFKNSNFKYDWPGYSSGNKLGFIKE
jgi:hypothetical protein